MHHCGDCGARCCGSGICFVGKKAEQLPAAAVAGESVRSPRRRPGATMYRLDSSAVSGGKPEADTVAVAETGAAVAALVDVVVENECARVCRVVACRFESAIEPWLADTGSRGDGESKV
eukprot:6197125-Pleurochrysis_carterae.AAC.3